MAEAFGKASEKQAKFFDKGLPLLDKPLQKGQAKGGDAFVNVAEKRRGKKAAEKEQKTAIGEQKQKEELRVAEGIDELARRKLLAQTGGSRSLLSPKAGGRGLLAARGQSTSLVPK